MSGLNGNGRAWDPEDIRILARHREGDPAAFDDFYQKYRGFVYGVIRKTIYNKGYNVQEDAEQDTWLKVWRNLHRLFPGGSQPTTWLYPIAHNTALDWNKHERRRPHHNYLSMAGDEDGNVFDYPAPVQKPDEGMVRADRKKALIKAFDRLSGRDMEIAAVRLLNEHSYEEVAAIQEIPMGTVKSRLSRAVDELRKSLKEAV